MRYMVNVKSNIQKDDFIPNMTRSFETTDVANGYITGKLMQLKFVYHLLQLTDKEQGRLLTEMAYASQKIGKCSDLSVNYIRYLHITNKRILLVLLSLQQEIIMCILLLQMCLQYPQSQPVIRCHTSLRPQMHSISDTIEMFVL